MKRMVDVISLDRNFSSAYETHVGAGFTVGAVEQTESHRLSPTLRPSDHPTRGRVPGRPQIPRPLPGRGKGVVSVDVWYIMTLTAAVRGILSLYLEQNC